MPSRRGKEQALTWLKSKMAEKDTLDAINAEVCYNVILDLENRRKAIGAMYHQTHSKIKRLESEKLYQDAVEAMKRYSEQNAMLEIMDEDIDENDPVLKLFKDTMNPEEMQNELEKREKLQRLYGLSLKYTPIEVSEETLRDIFGGD